MFKRRFRTYFIWRLGQCIGIIVMKLRLMRCRELESLSTAENVVGRVAQHLSKLHAFEEAGAV